MTIDADDSKSGAVLKAPSRGRKVERAFGPLGFPCAPAARPGQLTAPEPRLDEPVQLPQAAAAAPAPPRPRTGRPFTQRIGHGSIAIFAGSDALAELRDGGLRPERVRNFVCAAGGPKWLALDGIDRALFPWLFRRAQAPLHVLSSSIGSWRAAALASHDPLDALKRLSDEYIEQPHSRHPAPDQMHKILSAVLGPQGVAPLLSHPWLRLHIVTARLRLLSIQRVVFHRDGEAGPLAPWQDVPTQHVALTARNALDALQASAAIPSVMAGFGAEIDAADGFTLYPCFYPSAVPSRLDKVLSASMMARRTPSLRRTIMIVPSAAHLASLPGGKVPDRDDFVAMSDRERIAAWRHVIGLGHAMGYQLAELLDSDRIRYVAQPLA